MLPVHRQNAAGRFAEPRRRVRKCRRRFCTRGRSLCDGSRSSISKSPSSIVEDRSGAARCRRRAAATRRHIFTDQTTLCSTQPIRFQGSPVECEQAGRRLKRAACPSGTSSVGAGESFASMRPGHSRPSPPTGRGHEPTTRRIVSAVVVSAVVVSAVVVSAVVVSAVRPSSAVALISRGGPRHRAARPRRTCASWGGAMTDVNAPSITRRRSSRAGRPRTACRCSSVAI